jgi:hypothetical protein
MGAAVMIERIREASLRFKARMAGVSYWPTRKTGTLVLFVIAG